MHRHPKTRARGAILLEVILAVVLFAATAGVLIGGLNWSVRTVSDMRLESQGVDLAVTVLSEMQMGLIAPVNSGPNPFDWPYGAWTWTVQTGQFGYQIDGLGLDTLDVRIVVEHAERGITYTLVALVAPESLDEPDEGAGPLGENFGGGIR